VSYDRYSINLISPGAHLMMSEKYYYISVTRAHSTENQFTIAYLGLNYLASYAPKYAKKVDRKKLENPNAVSAKEDTINKTLQKRN
jgi:hypothetical protein